MKNKSYTFLIVILMSTLGWAFMYGIDSTEIPKEQDNDSPFLEEAKARSKKAKTTKLSILPTVKQNFNKSTVVSTKDDTNQDVLNESTDVTQSELDQVLDLEKMNLQPLSKNEKKSVRELTQIFLKYGDSNLTSEEMITQLSKRGLQPVSAVDSNEYTGTIITIQTESTLPGTRYFNAEFAQDDKGTQFLQRISFELRPGKDSFEKATEAIQDTFNFQGAPSSEYQGFKEWHKNGRTCWVKRITDLEELKSDLYNARSEEDLGVVVVACEINPHDNRVVREVN